MSKGADQWMPVHIAAYLQDTQHLTTEQHGAYFLLLMHGWTKGFLPDDDRALASICKVTRTRFVREMAPTLRQFFQAREGRLYQKRQELERAKAEKNIQQKVAAAHAKHSKFPAAKSNEINDDVDAAAPTAGLRIVQAAHVPIPVPIERVLPTEVPAAPDPGLVKPAQMGFLPPEPAKPLPPFKALQQEAFPILAWAMGKDLEVRADVVAVGKELNKLRGYAGNDDVAMLDIIRRLPRSEPQDQFNAIGWLTSAAKRAGITVVAQNDPNDGYGVQAWCRMLVERGIATESAPQDRANGKWLAKGRLIDNDATRLCRAARLPFNWRGDLDPILEWVSATQDVAWIERTIQRIAEGHDYKPDNLRRFTGIITQGRKGVAA